MNNSFAILAGFLDRGEAEVEGRALESPPEAVRSKLRDFARGELPEAERQALVDQLAVNRHWIPLLADEVKTLRSKAGNPPDTGKP
ncbi:MAG TPA: hypothetical protein VL970_14395 [Candidatus Acidoferrales bacterium]|nr:hypothetical protein [Candidatus Acidoferrales bacterium]